MKIERKTKGFQPFTIEIETEQEARVLWHRMNHSTAKQGELARGTATADQPFDTMHDSEVSAELWRAADRALNGEEFDND